jgi:inhibitor of cysteine peptidase
MREMGYRWVGLVGLVVGGLLLASGCVGDQAPVGEVRVGAGDDGGQVALAPRQVLAVELESNPTTGYGWEAVDLDTAVLRQVGEADYRPESNLVGGGGVETFHFQAVGAGQTTVKLVYRRPWEQGVAPLKTFTVEVTVR